ncbi:MAG: type IV toxin-antitoxin system AbiEi family antitoxin [Myxococcota bacterium]
MRFSAKPTFYIAFNEKRTVRASDYIEHLASRGFYHFTRKQAVSKLGGNAQAVAAQVRRLKEHGTISEPSRGFLVIVPPEYRKLGCLPAEQFIPQLMALNDEPYYLGLLSAAQRYGAAHQRPQLTQVIVRKNRSRIECGKVRVDFIARKDLTEMPVREVNTARGVVRYSSPEVTALELVGYPKHAGGLSNVATVLNELIEEMDTDRLLEAAELSPVSWSQRLGFLLEQVEQAELAGALRPFVAAHAKSYSPLRRSAGRAGRQSPDWKVIVNVDVEPDL